MTLEKRIKRRIIGRRHDFFAVTLPGFEDLCKEELSALSDTLQAEALTIGGVSFSGRLPDLYLAALHARVPVRLLMRLEEFKATNFQQLEKQIVSMDWELYLPRGQVPGLHVSARHSRLYHSDAIADCIAKGIAAHWAKQGIDLAPSGGQSLYVRLENDMVTLSMDACGEPLYQRGMKPHAAKAPLRETTAAGILLRAGFQPGDTLIDPMCGSGTFSLEAAMLAKQIPPGYLRNFAFMAWPAFRHRQWAHLKKAAAERIRDLDMAPIRSSDADGQAAERLRDCVMNNHLDDAIEVFHGDFFTIRPETGRSPKGLVVLNPPYGRRLQANGSTEHQYREIAAKLKSDFKGWRVALLVPHKRLARSLELPCKAFALQHGGLNLTLLSGRI